MVEQQALRVEYTIKHSFMDRIVFGKGEIISPFPFFSALRRPKLAEPLPLFRIMYMYIETRCLFFLWTTSQKQKPIKLK